MTDKQKPKKPPVKLPADELAALDEGIKSAEDGQRLTWDEVKQQARAQRKKWQSHQIEITA